jgi:predicted RNA-binding protein with PIN domain
LVFDLTKTKETENLARLKAIFNTKEYREFEPEKNTVGIVFNCGQNKALGKEISMELLDKVFEKETTTKYLFSISNHGRIK